MARPKYSQLRNKRERDRDHDDRQQDEEGRAGEQADRHPAGLDAELQLRLGELDLVADQGGEVAGGVGEQLADRGVLVDTGVWRRDVGARGRRHLQSSRRRHTDGRTLRGHPGGRDSCPLSLMHAPCQGRPINRADLRRHRPGEHRQQLVAEIGVREDEDVVAGVQDGVSSHRDELLVAHHEAHPDVVGAHREIADRHPVSARALRDHQTVDAVGLVPKAHAQRPGLGVVPPHGDVQPLRDGRHQGALDEDRAPSRPR